MASIKKKEASASRRAHRLPRYYSDVGSYLKALRGREGMTQREVAEFLGYSAAQFISNFECGIALPPLRKLKRLADLYGADVGRLIELILVAEKKLLVVGLGVRRSQAR
jgi:transcriptional regulator with XRE-family HTH domain